MFQALFLIALGALSRLIPHFWLHDAWNLVPIGAIGLFAGSRFPKRIAWAIPVFAMLLSDIVLDQKYGGHFGSPARWINYGAFALIAVMGFLANGPKLKVLRLAGLSLAGSVVFFLASNFGVWVWPEGTNYPMTFAGLIECYTAAIPFFKNSVRADLAGTAALFGLAPLLSRAWRRWAESEPAAELVTASTR